MKSEKEKMLAGEIYDANYDKELLAEREHCKMLCFEYNRFAPNQSTQKKELLRKLLGKCTENIIIEPSFWCDYGYNIEMGDNFYANHNLTVLDAAKVSIGSNVFIGPNCSIYTAGHPLEVESRNAGLEYAYPITIEDNVWIGGGVTILPGVTIGGGTTIGAGSIVTKDIPSGVVAAGNPCRVIRKI